MLVALIAAAALSAQPEPVPTPTPTATPKPVAVTKDVRKAARQAGFNAIAGRLARAARDAALVRPGQRAQAPTEAGTSRYGGDPDLPEGTAWPTCQGRAQTFLGQIRLGDLPREARALRRHGGTLLVFTHVEFEAPGVTDYGLWAGDCSRVIHVRPGSVVRRQARPKDTLDIVPAPMRFTTRPDIPDTSFQSTLMPPLRDVKVDDPQQYWELRWALLGKRDDDKLLGYSGQPNGGNDCSERAERRRSAWRHLFTFTRWEVADGGRLQLLIAPEDLRRGRFDRVCGVFDSA